MGTDSFFINIKIEDFYKDVANDVVERLDTSNYEFNRPLPTGKNEKVIRLMEDELGGRIMRDQKLTLTSWMMVRMIKKQKIAY